MAKDYQSTQTRNTGHRPADILQDARKKITSAPNEAISLLKDNIVILKDNAYAYFLLGRGFQEIKHNTNALINFSIAIYLDPRHTNSLISRGLTRGALQDLKGAEDDLNKALLLDPRNHVALLNRGVTRGALNKPNEAIEDFTLSIKIKPDFSDAFRNRGITRHLLGETKGACQDWKRAIELGDQEVKGWLMSLCGKASR